MGKTIKEEPKLDEILDKFSSRLEVCQNEYKKKEGSKLTYELARDIFKALGGDPDEEERKAKEAYDKEQEGKGRPGKGKKEAVEGKGEAKEVKEGDDEPFKFPDEEWCIRKVELKDLDKKLPTTHDLEQSNMSHVGLLHESDPSGREAWSMSETFVEVNYVTNTCSHSSYDSLLNTTSSYAEHFVENFNSRVRGKAITSENFAQQVRRLIQIRSRVKYEYGVKKGKLDQARLSRIALDSPGFQDRVFKNKISNTVLDAAVTVLVDMSGSMSGDKVFFACEATVLLNDVFKVLQVPLEIIGFTVTVFFGRMTVC